jgi:hypothetical protein
MARQVGGLHGFIAELKRRSVFKVASLYAVTAWGACLGAAELLPAFGAPAWAVRMFVVVAILGLPMAAVLAWAYEITAKGIVRDDGSGGANDDPAIPHGTTTVLYGSRGFVRVSWPGVSGPAEKVFHKDFLIGRDESCEVHIDDPMISRRHAEIIHRDGRWCIHDLGSRNGTVLDGQLVSSAGLPARAEVKLYAAAPPLVIEVGEPAGAPTEFG